MPINDIKCEKCGVREAMHKVAEIRKVDAKWCVPCPVCGSYSEILCTLTMQNNDWFRPHWNEGVSWDPVYVESKKHLKDLCLKNGCTNHALGDVRNITEI